MNVVLQRHGARHIYVVPEGLRELMSDISREVLRAQPMQLYGFIADYLDALMVTRENARVASTVVETLTDCSITIAELLQRTGMIREEAEKNAKIIQKAFRNFISRRSYGKGSDAVAENDMIDSLLEQLNISKEKAAHAAYIIQMAFKAFKERQRLFEEDQEFINWRAAMRNTMFIYRRTGIPGDVAARAATTIKAAYKGYYTRRYLRGRIHDSLTIPLHPDDKSRRIVHRTKYVGDYEVFGHSPCDKDLLDAVIYIQYWFRKFLRRQDSARIVRDIMAAISKYVVPTDSATSSTQPEQSTPVTLQFIDEQSWSPDLHFIDDESLTQTQDILFTEEQTTEYQVTTDRTEYETGPEDNTLAPTSSSETA